jgi:hypothetical protein
MKFICSIIVVQEIARSRKLYEHILHQKVTGDFGEYNVAFEGGLALYKKSLYQSLIGEDKPIKPQPNNFELYFEEDDLVEVEQEILKEGFEFIHRIREEPWKQQVFRFYDYDKNNIVIAESMGKTASRLFKENKTLAEIAQMTGMPVKELRILIDEYKG